jgi:transposase
MNKKRSSKYAIKDIRRKTRNKHSPEEKIRIVLEGIRCEESIAILYFR